MRLLQLEECKRLIALVDHQSDISALRNTYPSWSTTSVTVYVCSPGLLVIKTIVPVTCYSSKLLSGPEKEGLAPSATREMLENNSLGRSSIYHLYTLEQIAILVYFISHILFVLFSLLAIRSTLPITFCVSSSKLLALGSRRKDLCLATLETC